MDSNKDLIQKFYNAFANLDAERMIEYYHQDIIFEDPAFGVLRGEDAKNMWRMLCQSQQGKNFKVVASQIEASQNSGSARWEAYYNFGKKNRKIHNIITAKFDLKDGKIIKHTDHFNLYKWSKQAMGSKGVIMGWTAYFRKKLQKRTNYMLSEFKKKQSN